MNSITFDGRLAADAELRYTQSGEPILTFRVASDIGYGERKTTNWFSCQVWGKRGESLKNYLAKGQQVTVYGQLTLREWEDKDGNKRLAPDVRVNELSLQGGRQEGGESSTQRHEPPAAPRRREQQAPPPMDDLDDDGIPF
ncbi:single-stranded DNA-binding protein [Chromobacterium phragmitis]|uniref:single-stranded DNA-binding protein n=1 Tax=Chromobacterium amazonense TaxID=1382803 RepID=UPI0021B7C327|nr:single-stranded DNA-binding protein [Chromobacterium amazonense]MBM2883954.1 single-stranded DNA-binding protein [Chromobacterium amazonense]MDE1711872.1 single-stranded DNA-binding protein [Chromobacterium amazonense]